MRRSEPAALEHVNHRGVLAGKQWEPLAERLKHDVF